jgi:hypothetical protein
MENLNMVSWHWTTLDSSELHRRECWCNYMHNILPNINYQPRFVISRVDALYVSIIDRFLCLFSIA